MQAELFEKAQALWASRFDRPWTVGAYAPGRAEILGNHTDYNEGWTLSVAIDRGMVFLAAPNDDSQCRVAAADFSEETAFPARHPQPSADQPWSNYVRGVAAKLQPPENAAPAFDALFCGDIPIGAGLSSSAALEMAAGLALCDLYRLAPSRLELARIGQAAEHEFAGARCGLLDQLSSLCGRRQALILCDFRSLAVRPVALDADLCFLVCDTRVKHALVDGAYNERRASCEQGAAAFAALLDRPIAALRDVSWAEWETHAGRLDPVVARRTAHVIGENRRVLEGVDRLERKQSEAFGQLMFESHASSMENFENSCPELDFLVAAARARPGVLGARLSGGGFGGSVVVLTRIRDAQTVGRALETAYNRRFAAPCAILDIHPSDGARTLKPASGPVRSKDTAP
jgi:galactokinase